MRPSVVFALCCSLVVGARQRILQEELNATDWAHTAPPETTIEVRDNLPAALDAITDSLDLTQTNWSTDQYFTGSVLVLPAGVESISEEGVARTQISYNYSMSPRAWSLDADPNALSMDGCAYAIGGKAMDLHVANTSDVSPYAIGQVLIASAAWGCKDENDTLLHIAHLLVAEMVVNARANIVHLWASQASLNETFATTSIRFKSNDLGNTMASTAPTDSGRRLDAYSFSDRYVPSTFCTSLCGAYALAFNKCYRQSLDLPASSDCLGGQVKMYTHSSGTRMSCGYIEDCIGVSSSVNFTHNIAADGKSFVNPDIELYRSAGCGSGNYLAALPGSGCVRVGCANCGFWFAINEAEFTYDYGISRNGAWATGSTSMTAASYTSMGISLYAPDGGSKTWSKKVFSDSRAISLRIFGVPIVVDFTVSVDETVTATMQTSANPFVISNSVSMSVLKAKMDFASSASDKPWTVVDKVVTSEVQQPDAGDYAVVNVLAERTPTIDTTVRVAPGVNFGATVGLTFYLEMKIEGGRLPALSTPEIDPSTWSKGVYGNCMVPHLLEILVYAGINKAHIKPHIQLFWEYSTTQSLRWLAMRQTMLSYCYNPPYTATIAIAIDLPNAQTLAFDASSKAALLKYLGAALGFPALVAPVLAIQSIDSTLGIVRITAMVPSAVSSIYPTSESFDNSLAARAMTATFQKTIYDATYITAGATCPEGYWGQTCMTPCAMSTCQIVSSCVSVSGTVRACSSCVDGSWGTTCQNTCQHAYNCDYGLPATCDASTGTLISCASCDPGYWGNTCQYSCSPGASCTRGGALTCDQYTGTLTTCQGCVTGYWGDACTNTCPTPTTCASTATVACDQATSRALSCSSCLAGFWGSACQNECSVPSTCFTATCTADDGATETCPRCLVGFWGTRCESKCAPSSNCAAGTTVACNPTTGSLSMCGACKTGFTGATCAVTAPAVAVPPTPASLVLSGLAASDFSPTVKSAFVLSVVETFAQQGTSIGATDVVITSVTDVTSRQRGRQLSTASVAVAFTVAAPISSMQAMQTQPSLISASLVRNQVIANSDQVGALSVATTQAPPAAAPGSGIPTAVIIGAGAGGCFVLCVCGGLYWRWRSKTKQCRAPAIRVVPRTGAAAVEAVVDQTLPIPGATPPS